MLRNEERELIHSFLDWRFGIKREHFTEYDIYAFSRQAFLFRTQREDFILPRGHFLRCGLPFMRNVAGYLKPTTYFIQRFGDLAHKNIITLGKEELIELCEKGELALDKNSKDIEGPGYVITKLDEHVLGVNLLIENRLLCRLPKALKEAIKRLKKSQ